MADHSSPELAPAILKYAKQAFDDLKAASASPPAGLDDFLKRLVDPVSAEPAPILADLSHPISNYFISSSHNTYLTGNQLWSKSSTDAYKDVLQRGCRCIEIDVWDGGSPAAASSGDETEGKENKDVKKLTSLFKKGLGKLHAKESSTDAPAAAQETVPADEPVDDQPHMPTPWRTNSGRAEPRVLHGHTATKEVPFRSVCEVIQKYAFDASDLPLIVSLEVHCSHEQQDVMVEIMTDYWGQYLVTLPEDFSDATPLPMLESLKHKILIKVKHSPAKNPPVEKSIAHAQTTSTAEHDSSDEESQMQSEKKGKISEALSNMGIYTRSCHFKKFDQPEATVPSHVFALSEAKLMELQEEHGEALLHHNRNFLMRAYPRGTRLGSSNLDPAPFWRQGVQMVALNWQQMNASMMMNDAMFAGTKGWALKPSSYRDRLHDTDPVLKPQSLNFAIRILAAQNLDLSARSTPSAFVMCELHVESGTNDKQRRTSDDAKAGDKRWKQRTTGAQHSRDPDFSGENLEFKGINNVVPELSFVRLKVMDDVSLGRDRLLGWSCFRLDRFAPGIRLLPLKGADSKATGSTLLIQSSYTLSDSP